MPSPPPQPTPLGPDWLSVAQTAKRLEATNLTVYSFIDSGQLPGYQVGRVIRLRAHEVEAFIDASGVEPGKLGRLAPRRKGAGQQQGAMRSRRSRSRQKKRGRPLRARAPALGRETGSVPPPFAPMLAGRGRPVGTLAGWAVEPKLDGWRCLVSVSGGVVDVRTRSGRRLPAEQLPALAPLAAHEVDLLLDGELVAGGGRCEDFYRLSTRMLTRRADGVTLAAFDLLWADGADLTTQPYGERRDVLESLGLPPAVSVVPRYPGHDIDELLAACEEQGMEGVVLKRQGSVYRPGRRTKDWRKVKCPGWAEHAPRRLPTEVRAAMAGAEQGTQAGEASPTAGS